MARRVLAFAAFVCLLAAARDTAWGEPLTGDVGAAYSTPDAASKNPANAALLDRTQVGFNPTLFTSESYLIRYPGFDASAQGQSGANLPPLAIPQFIWKVTPRIGIGGIAAPPGIALPIAIKRIPLVVLKTLNYVDITGNATVKGYASLVAGWRIANTVAIGLGGSYGAADIDAAMTPSDGGAALVTIKGSASVANATAGLRWDVVPGRLALGAAFGLISVQSLNLDISSPLLSAGGGAGPGLGDGSTTSPTTIQNPLDSVLLGFQLAFSPKARLLADMQYSRAPKGALGFSIVELKQKPRDLHDVLAARAGVILAVNAGANALIGFKYQPSAIGPGTPGADGLNGFGTLDVIQTFIPVVGEELKPFWQVGVGMQYGFGLQVERKAARKGADGVAHATSYYSWTVATGIVYKRASLGVDESGELPGAYLRTTTTVPLQLTYRF